MVLDKGHRDEVGSVDEGLEGELLAHQPLLDHDRTAELASIGTGSVAVDLLAHHADALTAGQADRLDRQVSRVVLDEPYRLFAVGEPPIRGGARDTVPGHQVPGIGLVGLDPRRRSCRAERRDAGLPERIDQSGLERGLGTDQDQVHRLFSCEPDDTLDLGLLREQDRIGECGDPGVSGRHHGRNACLALPGERRRDRVLPSSATHHQVLHRYAYLY